jgi:elongation of very long chain fatty acids protein 6
VRNWFQAFAFKCNLCHHTEVPVFAVALYLSFVFVVPTLLEHRKEGFSLKWPFAAWNVALALFSVCGSVRTLPHLYEHLVTKGFDYTVCEDPRSWYSDGPTGLWMALFIFSKIPELVDTCFLAGLLAALLHSPYSPRYFAVKTRFN